MAQRKAFTECAFIKLELTKNIQQSLSRLKARGYILCLDEMMLAEDSIKLSH